MAAAMAAVAAVAPNAVFNFTHDGSPDYADAADVAALDSDPWVHLEGSDHQLVKATGFAPWQDSPVSAALGCSPGKCIRQSILDSWCLAGGAITAFLHQHKNLLLLSAKPSNAGDLFVAHALVGDLDLSKDYTTGTWFKALSASARSCRDDARIQLNDHFFFNCQPRPVGGAGSAAADNWMYLFGGEVLLSENDVSGEVVGLLMRATAPRNKAGDRDANSTNFRRLLNALKKIAMSQSSYFKDALTDASTPAEEVTEYVADTWRKLVESGYPFKFGDRVSQRNMEIDCASRLAFGTVAQKELAFKSLLADFIDASPLIKQCLCDPSGNKLLIEEQEGFEQLATLFFPGSKWTTFSMVRAIELELRDMAGVIYSWSGISIIEKLACLRTHLKASKLFSSKGDSFGSGDNNGSGDSFILGASGIQATRSADFLETRMKIKDLMDSSSRTFTEVIDILSESKSKLWRAVGLGKFKRATGIPEVEACSKYIDEWPRYWTIGLATDSQGNVKKAAQGMPQSVANTEGFLAGNWGSGVDWIEVNSSLDFYCYGIMPNPRASYTDPDTGFATLTGVMETICQSMQLLKIANLTDRDGYTARGFLTRIITLERRSRALPAESEVILLARQEVEDLLKEGLDEFGKRWVNQFKAPVNYLEPLYTSFSDSNCFVYNKLDTAEDTANKVYQFRNVLNKEPSFQAGSSPNPKGVRLSLHKET